MKSSDNDVSLAPTDIIFNQNCTAFDKEEEEGESEYGSPFQVYITFSGTTGNFEGYTYELKLQNTKGLQIPLLCVFTKNVNYMKCNVFQLPDGDLSGVYHLVYPTSNINLVCNIAGTEDSASCELQQINFPNQKTVIYNEHPSILSPPKESFAIQPYDLSRQSSFIYIEMKYIDLADEPSFYLNGEELDCSIEDDFSGIIKCDIRNPDNFETGYHKLIMKNSCNNEEDTGITIDVYDSTKPENTSNSNQLKFYLSSILISLALLF